MRELERLLGKTRKELKQKLGEPSSFGGFSSVLPWETVWIYDNVIFIFDDEYHIGVILDFRPGNGPEELVLNKESLECQLL